MVTFSGTAEEMAIIDTLNDESDRAVAIIGACLLEDRIETAIKAKLREDTKAEAEMFGTNRPLGTFSAKNRLAFLLRCYGRAMYAELDTINDIRNKFAHRYNIKGNEVRDFESVPIRDLCRNLKLLEGYLLPTSAFNQKYGKRKSIAEVPGGTMHAENVEPILNNNRHRFITTVGLFTVHLGICPTDSTYVQMLGDEQLPSLSRRL